MLSLPGISIKLSFEHICFLLIHKTYKKTKVINVGDVLVGGENKYEGDGQELLNDQNVRKSFLGG